MFKGSVKEGRRSLIAAMVIASFPRLNQKPEVELKAARRSV